MELAIKIILHILFISLIIFFSYATWKVFQPGQSKKFYETGKKAFPTSLIALIGEQFLLIYLRSSVLIGLAGSISTYVILLTKLLI